MFPNDPARTISETCPTQHAMLVVWGYFAHSIGLLDGWDQVPLAQKTVKRPPHEKILELLLGILAGIEYLTDLSEGAAPLVRDQAVAQAWQLQTLAEASGVSRTLQACTPQAVAHLEAVLAGITQPFLDRAVEDLRQRQETLVLDADLTGRPVSSTSRTYPDAAFGYMDGEVRLGYQLAQICLHTPLFGRQWLCAHHHPGNRVSAECLQDLVQEAEQRLGCPPRRRTEWVQQRLQTSRHELAQWEQKVTHLQQRVEAQTQRVTRLTEQIQQATKQIRAWQRKPVSPRQGGPYSKLRRQQKQRKGWQRQRRRAQEQRTHLQARVQHAQEQQQAQAAEVQQLQARYDRLSQDNTRQTHPPRCKMRLDAGFSWGVNLTELIELGYDIDTKSAQEAVVQALRHRIPADAEWTPVGKNAEMMGWTNYFLNTCPYPLIVGLERFHTPQGVLHAVLIRNQKTPQEPCPDLKQWFHEYNGRQTIEAGNKEEKTTFKVQHLLSRSAAGVRLQAVLTVFAANFIRWADEWIRPRVEHSSPRFEALLARPKRLVRVAANSPATVERQGSQVLVRFSPLSSFDGVVIRLSGAAGHQLLLSLFANDHFEAI